MKRLLATSALLFASSAFAAQTLTGVWTIHSKINDTESDIECKLVATDNKLTGSCNFQDKDRQVTGTVAGDKVTLQYDADYNGTAFTLVYTGTLDNSGKIAGIVRLQPFNVDGLFTAAPGRCLLNLGVHVLDGESIRPAIRIRLGLWLRRSYRTAPTRL
jgi:hypothetical protein